MNNVMDSDNSLSYTVPIVGFTVILQRRVLAHRCSRENLVLTSKKTALFWHVLRHSTLIDLAARVTTLETNATSVSSGSGSENSWNLPGHGNGSTATGSLGSHGQGSSDDNRNTRCRLDTFSSPEDEHARSAVLLRFPFEQYREGVSAWINSFWATTIAPALDKATRIHFKTDPISARIVFGHTGITN